MNEPHTLPQDNSESPILNAVARETKVNILDNEESSGIVPMDIVQDEEPYAFGSTDSSKEEEKIGTYVSNNEESSNIIKDVTTNIDAVVPSPFNNIENKEEPPEAAICDAENKGPGVICPVSSIENKEESPGAAICDAENKGPGVIFPDSSIEMDIADNEESNTFLGEESRTVVEGAVDDAKNNVDDFLAGNVEMIDANSEETSVGILDDNKIDEESNIDDNENTPDKESTAIVTVDNTKTETAGLLSSNDSTTMHVATNEDSTAIVTLDDASNKDTTVIDSCSKNIPNEFTNAVAVTAENVKMSIADNEDYDKDFKMVDVNNEDTTEVKSCSENILNKGDDAIPIAPAENVEMDIADNDEPTKVATVANANNDINAVESHTKDIINEDASATQISPIENLGNNDEITASITVSENDDSNAISTDNKVNYEDNKDSTVVVSTEDSNNVDTTAVDFHSKSSENDDGAVAVSVVENIEMSIADKDESEALVTVDDAENEDISAVAPMDCVEADITENIKDNDVMENADLIVEIAGGNRKSFDTASIVGKIEKKESEPTEISNNDAKDNKDRMENTDQVNIDTVEVANVNSKSSNAIPVTDNIEEKESKPIRLVIEGFDDQNEQTTVKTVEEVQNYVATKAVEYLKDSQINPLLVLKKKSMELNEKIQKKSDDLMKIKKLYEIIQKDQKKFLTYIGVLPKPLLKTVGVSVDLPWLPESVPNILPEDSLIKAKSRESAAVAAPPKQLPKKTGTGPIECIDLTDDDSASAAPPGIDRKPLLLGTAGPSNIPPTLSSTFIGRVQHPAPLPAPINADSPLFKAIPIPKLKISAEDKGIILQWDIPPQMKSSKLQGFEIFGYQEKSNLPISSSLWKKIGSVRIMPLPMSCSLTQFVEGFKYHFTIRALDLESQCGGFSDPASITFLPRRRT